METDDAANDSPKRAVRAIMDSNVLIAHVNPNDSLHKAALALIELAAQAKLEVVYFDCVVAESLSVIARRLEEKKRMNEFGALADRLFEIAPEVDWEWLFPEAPRLFNTVIELMRQTSGQLNFNDALIVVACRELGINTLLSFDTDFDTIPDLTRLK